MKILIYGSGAVGLGIASCLIRVGETPHLICRSQTANALRTNGLKRTGIFGDDEHPSNSFTIHENLEEVPAENYDYICVTTKSFDSERAANDIAKHARTVGTPKIVLFQNGWGNAEIFSDHFPKDHIYNARVITGFERPKPHHVNITVHADSIRVGSLFSEETTPLKPLAEMITHGGLPCETTEKVGQYLWAKLLYNCALNSLGAIVNTPYGTLGEYPETKALMEQIIHEGFAVMTANGHRTLFDTPEDYLSAFYQQMLPSTYHHKSSTLQDIKAKKRTEIDNLNGMVVKLGAPHSIPTTVNATVYKIVKFIEKNNLT